MGFDLRNMTGKQALVLAKAMSGLDSEDIAERTGYPYSCIRQYFKESSHEYFSSFNRIPTLCQALGNNILLDWIHAQLGLDKQEPGQMSGVELLRSAARLSAEVGDVSEAVDSGLEDGVIDQEEAQSICGEIEDVERQCSLIRNGLQRVAGQCTEGQVLRNGKVLTIKLEA